MLFDFFNAVRQGDLISVIGTLAAAVIIIFVCFPVHESAHAYASYKLGDPTAKYQGRISLNPAHHLDLLGSILILICGFGYAKAVPVNIHNFKNQKRDMALTALAGPLSNILMAVIFMAILKVFDIMLGFVTVPYNVILIISLILQYGASINISLAVFNMIPLPPLDGSRILGLFLSDSLYYKIMQNEQMLFVITLALVALGAFSNVISTVSGFIYSVLFNLFW